MELEINNKSNNNNDDDDTIIAYFQKHISNFKKEVVAKILNILKEI